MSQATTSHGPVLRGEIHAIFAYDAGFQIDLSLAATLLTEALPERAVRVRRPSPAWFEYDAPPMRLTLQGDSVQIGSWTTEPNADGLIYDFGAAVVTFSIRFEATPSALVEITRALYDNASLKAEAQRRLASVLDAASRAITKPHLSDQVEDYVLIAVREWPDGVAPQELVDAHASDWARAIQAEALPLSPAEVERALASRSSYTSDDIAVIDWNASLLIDRSPDDMIAVLRHANVELLEMRLLDQHLDHLLDGAYHLLHRVGRPGLFVSFRSRRALSRFAEIQADSALMFEGVNNAIKLLGDQYLARVYRLASAKLDLNSWDDSVLRKIATAESIYQKLTDAETTRRMEVLEIIIIVLILISIVMPFIPGVGGH